MAVSQQTEVSDLHRVLEVARALGAVRDQTQLLEMILAAARDVLNCERASLFMCDGHGNLWSKVAQESATIRLDRGKGIAGSVAANGEPINIADAYNDVRFDPANDKATGFVTRSILCMPLVDHNNAILGVIQLLNKNGGIFSSHDEQILSALCAQAGVALSRAKLLKRDQERQAMQQELELAQRIQQSLLPQSMPELPHWDLAAWQHPCDHTGGDYHDVILNHNSVDIMLGDVTGHGIGAALLMAGARSSLRALHPYAEDPAQLVQRLNERLVLDLADDAFMSFVFCRLGEDGNSSYVSAGHDVPLVYRQHSGQFDELIDTGMLLGIRANEPYDCHQLAPLHTGDVLVTFTDGFTEAGMHQGLEAFGMQRMRSVIAAHASTPAHTICAHLVDAVREHLGDQAQADDLSLIVAKRT